MAIFSADTELLRAGLRGAAATAAAALFPWFESNVGKYAAAD